MDSQTERNEVSKFSNRFHGKYSQSELSSKESRNSTRKSEVCYDSGVLNKNWYCGLLSKLEVEYLLNPRENGLFVVYESKEQRQLIVAVCQNEIVNHFNIWTIDGKKTIDKLQYFSTLNELIDNHSKFAVGVVPKLKKSPSLSMFRNTIRKGVSNPTLNITLQGTQKLKKISTLSLQENKINHTDFSQKEEFSAKKPEKIRKMASHLALPKRRLDRAKFAVLRYLKIKKKSEEANSVQMLDVDSFGSESGDSEGDVFGGNKFQAMYDYTPNYGEEYINMLSIKKGDILNEIKRCNEQAFGWIWVCNERGLKGFVPETYIEKLTEQVIETGDKRSSIENDSLNLSFNETVEMNAKIDRTSEWVCKQQRSISSGFGSDAKVPYDEIVAKPLMSTDEPKILKKLTHWIDVPKVKKSSIMKTMTENELKRQEAMFEVLSSEQSYHKSLAILLDHFYKKIKVIQQYQLIINEEQFNNVFSNIVSVAKVSEDLITDHEERWVDVLMHDVCDVLRFHLENYMEQVFIEYCENHSKQCETLEWLMRNNEKFRSLVTKLESEKEAEKMSLSSYLFLPIQRIMKYKILIDAVKKYVSASGNQWFSSCEEAHRWAQQVIVKCNNVVNSKITSKYESLLKFPKNIPKIDLSIPKAFRQLVEEQQVTLLKCEYYKPLNIIKEKRVQLLQFSDIFLIASLKSLKVIDYCNVSNLQLKKIKRKRYADINEDYYIMPAGVTIPEKFCYPCQLIILRNFEDDSVGYTLNFNDKNERDLWLELLNVRNKSSVD